MELVTTDIGNTAARVALVGKLDIAGAEVVALPLATLAGAKQGLIIDMSGVSFLSSIGIRHLIMAANVQSRRGARLVLLNPTTLIAGVLANAGLADLLPIVHSEAEAISAVSFAD